MACNPHRPPITDTDRRWDNDYYKVISRPVETMVMRKLDLGIPHGYEPTDELEAYRRGRLEFDMADWELYLLLMHYKNRVRFGNSDRARQQERDVLIMLGSVQYLGIGFPTLIIAHAELLTKMIRRKRQGLPEVPEIPIHARERVKGLLKRFAYQNKEAV